RHGPRTRACNVGSRAQSFPGRVCSRRPPPTPTPGTGPPAQAAARGRALGGDDLAGNVELRQVDGARLGGAVGRFGHVDAHLAAGQLQAEVQEQVVELAHRLALDGEDVVALRQAPRSAGEFSATWDSRTGVPGRVSFSSTTPRKPYSTSLPSRS